MVRVKFLLANADRRQWNGQWNGFLLPGTLGATELKSEVICDLQGHLEVTLASEATNMVVRDNMHMGFRVIELADYKSDVKFIYLCHKGC